VGNGFVNKIFVPDIIAQWDNLTYFSSNFKMIVALFFSSVRYNNLSTTFGCNTIKACGIRIVPKRLTIYFPVNPVAPKTVATCPPAARFFFRSNMTVRYKGLYYIHIEVHTAGTLLLCFPLTTEVQEPAIQTVNNVYKSQKQRNIP
jgi:hypothetical protein